MNKVKEFITYFTKEERLLWISSVGAILISFCVFDRENYLTFRRDPYFAVAYATNDIVLIVLWVLASVEDVQYIHIACFRSIFLQFMNP